jgi:hypothetical protein
LNKPETTLLVSTSTDVLLSIASIDLILGSIGGQHLFDVMFEGLPKGGPFSSVKEFHDWFANQANRFHPNLEEFVDPMRPGLPDSASIKFTHGDLHRSNIIMSPDSNPPRIRAIIDWQQSGWYPDYWEYCKAIYTVHANDEWVLKFAPTLVGIPNCLNYWDFYMNALGC